MGRKKSAIPGFSLNRALGITAAKQKIARATGIPTTKQGRKRKMQRYLWTAVAAGTYAAVSKPDTAQQHSSAPQDAKRRPGCLTTVVILIVAFMVLTGISNALAKALHTTKHPTGERLNINNVEKYAPSLNDKQEDQLTPAVAEASDGEEYYTEEEQAAAAAAYYASIGGNPYLQDDAEADTAEVPTEESYTYTLNTNTKVFHRQSCPSAKRIKDQNRSSATGTRDEIIEKGYSPCGICRP